jgi:hypothetical protein
MQLIYSFLINFKMNYTGFKAKRNFFLKGGWKKTIVRSNKELQIL